LCFVTRKLSIVFVRFRAPFTMDRTYPDGLNSFEFGHNPSHLECVNPFNGWQGPGQTAVLLC
jgi:hypothetical protein